jgi:hypothetical protein
MCVVVRPEERDLQALIVDEPKHEDVADPRLDLPDEALPTLKKSPPPPVYNFISTPYSQKVSILRDRLRHLHQDWLHFGRDLKSIHVPHSDLDIE